MVRKIALAICDLRLNPPQQSAPLNYFIYPYVEIDGKSWPNIDQQFSFEDSVARTQTASLTGTN